MSSQEKTEFDMGHINIKANSHEITSEGKQPNQSMMIFLSITDLLIGVAKLLSDRGNKKYEFVGADSSFSIIFKLYKDGQIGVWHNDDLIAKLQPKELVLALWSATVPFYNQYAGQLAGSGAGIEDWNYAIDQFQKAFGEYLKSCDATLLLK